MANKGNALMGIGIGSGEERITEAARKAIFSPLLETTIDGAQDVIVNVTGGLDMTLTEAEEASEIISQAAGKGVNIWLGTSIDDTMKDEIRVTVVATGVRQDRAEQAAGFQQPTRSFTQANAQQAAGAQYASERTQQPNQTTFERRSSFDYDMGESHAMPASQQPAANQSQQKENSFGNWDLRRDNIARPTEGELDSKLTMSTFTANDDADDELETPPFFKNR